MKSSVEGADQDDDSSQWRILIEEARSASASSVDALGRLVNKFRDHLLAVADREIGTQLQAKFDASDVVQISLVEAMGSIDQFRGSSKDEFRSWLTKIVLHNLQDEARRYTKTHSRSIARENTSAGILEALRDDLHRTPASILSAHEQELQLKTLIKRLPEQQQLILDCRHQLEMSYQEIAEKLDITEAAARKLWSRATIQLREWLNEESSG